MAHHTLSQSTLPRSEPANNSHIQNCSSGHRDVRLKNSSPQQRPATAAGSSDALLASKEAARFLHIAPQTLAQWRMTRRVDIPFVRIGRRVMYRRSDLVAFIAANLHGVQRNEI